MKTVRFASVVSESGVPQIHLSWSSPEKDPALQRALKQQRVMTVHRHTRGAKKDYASVGLEPGRNAQFLVFPRSLRAFRDRRIIGIQYDMLGEGLSLGPTPPASARQPAHKPPPVKTPRIQRRQPARPAADLVPFEPPDPSPRRTRPVPPTPQRREAPARLRVVRYRDPLLGDVKRALDDLKAGRTRAAERRLQAVLENAETQEISDNP